jgi:hypothetical protein
MSLLPSKEKYIMFLEAKYFKKHIFKTIYNKILKKLKNKGIVVFEIDTAIERIKLSHKKKSSNNLSFDDLPFPNSNTLYIHLFNNQYYCDKLFNKTKVEVEREMLFLLAGKLGVKEINYETEVVETVITKLNSNIKIKGINNGLTFNKNINKTLGTKGKEEYLNRGAPVYLKSNNLEEVENNIKDRMGMMQSNVFNYDFYKNSNKLESFVYKRYEFKMQKLEYTIETDDISDISFAVNSCFIEYGINLSFDKSININENIHYTIQFYNDTELYKEFGKIKRNHMDEFYSIRELYELMDDKDISVHLITEYVMNFAKNYKYKINNKIKDFSKNIDDFIKNNEYGCFEGVCHNFHSTSQIKNWINKTFLTNDMEIINIINPPINEIPNVNKFKKEELDKSTKCYKEDNKRVEELNLQKQLEDIAHSDDELKNIIKNCNAEKNNSTALNGPVSINDWDIEENKPKSAVESKPFGFDNEMFSHYLCTAVLSDIRPPIIPSSCTTSIHSEDDAPPFLPPTPNERETDI